MFSAHAHSLNGNYLTGNNYDDMSGILKLAEALPHSQLTSLRWPTSPLNSAWTFCLYLPLRQQPLTQLSVAARSLNDNNLTNYGRDMSAVLKLAEMLPQSKIQTLRCISAKCSRSLLAHLESDEC